MFNQILAKLKEKIETLSSVKAVYDYEAKTYSAYPCVVIVPIGYSDEYLSLGKIKRNFEFRIRVINYSDKEAVNLRDIQVALRDAVDDILNLLNSRANITLDGLVDYSVLTEADFSFAEREGAVYVCNMVYRAVKSVNF